MVFFSEHNLGQMRVGMHVCTGSWVYVGWFSRKQKINKIVTYIMSKRAANESEKFHIVLTMALLMAFTFLWIFKI